MASVGGRLRTDWSWTSTKHSSYGWSLLDNLMQSVKFSWLSATTICELCILVNVYRPLTNQKEIQQSVLDALRVWINVIPFGTLVSFSTLNCRWRIVSMALLATGVARILCWGGPENRGAVGAEFETPKASRGIPLPRRLEGLGDHRKLGSGNFGAFWAWKNESGDDKFDILCHFYSAYLESNLQGQLCYFFLIRWGGGLGPSGPPLATHMLLAAASITFDSRSQFDDLRQLADALHTFGVHAFIASCNRLLQRCPVRAHRHGHALGDYRQCFLLRHD